MIIYKLIYEIKMKKLIFLCSVIAIISACSSSDNKTQQADKMNSQDQVEITNDLENAFSIIPSWYNENHVIEMTAPPAHSGTFACITNDTLQYSYYFKEVLKNINGGLPKKVSVSGWVYTTAPNPTFSIVCNIDESGKSVNWKAVPLKDDLNEAGKWVEFNANFFYDNVQLKPENEIGILAWNQDKKTVYIDDLKIVLQY